MPPPKGSMTGEKNPKWRGGKWINHEGYVYFSAGPHRGKREHRVVVELLDKEGPCHLVRPLDKDIHIHHINFLKTCNHPHNLLVLDTVIHNSFDAPGVARRLVKWKIGTMQKKLFEESREEEEFTDAL